MGFLSDLHALCTHGILYSVHKFAIMVWYIHFRLLQIMLMYLSQRPALDSYLASPRAVMGAIAATMTPAVAPPREEHS